MQFYSSKLEHSATDHTATICQIIPENKNPPKDFVTPIRWDKTLGLNLRGSCFNLFCQPPVSHKNPNYKNYKLV